jgi:hypothetical protein
MHLELRNKTWSLSLSFTRQQMVAICNHLIQMNFTRLVTHSVTQ